MEVKTFDAFDGLLLDTTSMDWRQTFRDEVVASPLARAVERPML